MTEFLYSSVCISNNSQHPRFTTLILSEDRISAISNPTHTSEPEQKITISGSDERDKADITNFTHGLSFIKQLRPVTYKWDKRVWYVGDNPAPQDILDAVPDGTHKKGRVNLGFLDQEVHALEQEIGYGNSKEDRLVTSITDDQTSMGVKYERIVPILVNAIKELLTRIETLESA